MINITDSIELFKKIYSNQALSERIVNYVKENEKKINKYVDLGTKGKWKSALKKDPFFKLCLTFAFLPVIKKKYDENNVSEKIFFDTMKDIKIWIDDYFEHSGEYGLDEFNWIVNHLDFKIFAIGRLQFKLGKYFYKKSYNSENLVLKFSDEVIEIHIPRGGKLTIEDCKASIDNAKEFFNCNFPDYPTDAYVCYSWLLYSGNAKFMSPESNIIKFASLFEVMFENENPNQAYRWAFGKNISSLKLIKNRKKNGSYGELQDVKVMNSFQQKISDYINNGGKLGDSLGVINTSKVDWDKYIKK